MTHQKGTMSNKIVLRPAAPSSHRPESILKSTSKHHVGEVVGGTAAECVAVCCCFPCGLANFLILAVYKLPAGLCRRVMKKRSWQRTVKEGRLPPPIKRHHCSCGCCDVNSLRVHPLCENDAYDIKTLHSIEHNDKDAMALEKEMWDRFYSTGFWRSSSRRETSSQASPETDA